MTNAEQQQGTKKERERESASYLSNFSFPGKLKMTLNFSKPQFPLLKTEIIIGIYGAECKRFSAMPSTQKTFNKVTFYYSHN